MDTRQIFVSVSVPLQSERLRPDVLLSARELGSEECFTLHGHVISLSCRNTISAKTFPWKVKDLCLQLPRDETRMIQHFDWISPHAEHAEHAEYAARHSIFLRARQEFANSGMFNIHNPNVCHCVLVESGFNYAFMSFMIHFFFFPAKEIQ